MAEAAGGERRAGSQELLERLGRLEAAVNAQARDTARLSASEAVRDAKIDALILVMQSGKGAVRILAWMGGTILGAASLLTLLRDYYGR